MARKLKVFVPDSLNEVTLSMAMSFYDVQGNEKISDNTKWIHCVSAFCGLKLEDVAGMKQKDLKGIYASIVELLDGAEKEPLRMFFSFGGVEYGLEPDMTGMSGSVFIDLDNLCRDNWVPNLHKIMAILYRPIVNTAGDYYSICNYSKEKFEDRKHREKIFLARMPYVYVRGLTLFFSKVVMKHSDGSKKGVSSLGGVVKSLMTGDGSIPSTDSQKETLQKQKH